MLPAILAGWNAAEGGREEMKLVRCLSIAIAIVAACSAPALSRAQACPGELSAPARTTIGTMTWPAVAFASREAKGGAFAVSPPLAWALSALLFAGRAPVVAPNGEPNTEYPETPASSFLPLLGYPDASNAQRSVAEDLSALATTLSADGVRFAAGIFLGSPENAPRPVRGIAAAKCLRISLNPVTPGKDYFRGLTSINAWARDQTGGLIDEAVRPEEEIGGFGTGDVLLAATLHITLVQAVAGIQKASSLFVPSASGSEEIRDEVVYPLYRDSGSRVLGVAIPAHGGGTLYAFTAPAREQLDAFEQSLSAPTWQSIRGQFKPALGTVYLGAAFSTETYDYAGRVAAFGGMTTPASHKASILAHGSTFDAALTSDTTINNPPCCSDAAPTPPGLPADRFTMRAGGPALYVFEDKDGLILLVAGD